jgi:glycosyltransferase involved in cell wall biosynthesis
MPQPNSTKIAWLLPTTWFYWQPSLSELTQHFPNTKIFTGLFSGFAKGFENALDVEVVGQRKVVAVTQSATSYGDNFTYLSPKILPRLFQYRPQVVFSSSFGIWTMLALLSKWLGGWKVVIAYEGSSPSVDYRNSLLRLTLRRAMVWAANACITNSHAGQKYLINSLGAPPELTFVQPYEVPDVRSLAGVNEALEYVTPANTVRFSDLKRPVFLFVGSLVPRKGVSCLLEACKLLKESGINGFSVLLVGDGPQREALQSFTQQHQLQDCVTWVGRVNYSDIGTYFHHADVFVLPTLEDTWGMVVLEAMLLGKAILCSVGAGAAELVREGENGFCFAPNDSEVLAAAMQRLIEAPDRIAAMGDRSKAIMADYSPQKSGEFLSHVVTTVLGGEMP